MGKVGTKRLYPRLSVLFDTTGRSAARPQRAQNLQMVSGNVMGE